MTRILILTSDLFFEHKPWFPHPERPERLKIVLEAAEETGVLRVSEVIKPSIEADVNLALLIHEKEYVERVKNLSSSGGGMLDADTYVCSKTFDAALTALGLAKTAVEKTLKGETRHVVVLPRPPGHHAGRRGVAMGAPTLGFCIFNTSALTSTLLAERGLKVLQVDFDLHHGNGTQDILYSDPRIIHVDLHQDPATIYPGTGWPWQTGEGEARGTKLNVLLPPGSGDDAFEEAVDKVICLVEKIMGRPNVLVYSAGFDAYRGDGLGMLRATSRTFHMLGYRLRRELGDPPTITVWEGGYDEGLRRGYPAFLAGLAGEEDPISDEPTKSKLTVISELKSNLKELEKHVL